MVLMVVGVRKPTWSPEKGRWVLPGENDMEFIEKLPKVEKAVKPVSKKLV
jgi:hypothetical protein